MRHVIPGGAWIPAFAGMTVVVLFPARASNNLADLLHVAANAGDGVAAGEEQGDQGQGEYFFHGVALKN
jgi:hypothetical protein